MNGYAAAEVFSKTEQALFYEAKKIVSKLPLKDSQGRWVRCHEVARFVGAMLGLTVSDGHYGMVDHSWLWTTALPAVRTKHPGRWFGPPPNILDSYAVGRMPLVQLVHSSTNLPYEYRRGDKRRDVRQEVLEELFKALKGKRR